MGLRHWLFRKKYQPILFPDEHWFQSVGELSKEQAEAYFLWHTKISEARAEYLLKFASDDQGVELNYSPESLVTVWKSVKKGIKGVWIKPSKAGLDKMGLALGLHRPYLVPDKFSALLAIDLGHLLFWIFRSHYPKIDWALGSKKDDAYNLAILTGFRATLIPQRVATNCILKGLRKVDTPTILLDTYQHWAELASEM